MADPTVMERKAFAKMGLAMPDGSYYVRQGSVGASDLQNAIEAVGRGEAAGDDGAAIRRHIMKRAADLKLSDKIPDTWNPDGTLKHSDVDLVDEFLAHHGVPGMRWGHRKGSSGSDTHTVRVPSGSSEDHVRTVVIKDKAKVGGGIHALSNDELKVANERLNLEQNYHRLTSEPSKIVKGHNFVKAVVGGAKTGVDAVDTGRRVVKTVKDIQELASK
jgi:hypothetical protein